MSSPSRAPFLHRWSRSQGDSEPGSPRRATAPRGPGEARLVSTSSTSCHVPSAGSRSPVLWRRSDGADEMPVDSSARATPSSSGRSRTCRSASCRARLPLPDTGAGQLLRAWGEDEPSNQVVDRLAPLAESTLVVDNIFTTDLDPASGRRRGDAGHPASRRAASTPHRLLPRPSRSTRSCARDLAHVRSLYSIGGLSFGNISAAITTESFWMSASASTRGAARPGRPGHH
jgi:hypothetical protein